MFNSYLIYHIISIFIYIKATLYKFNILIQSFGHYHKSKINTSFSAYFIKNIFLRMKMETGILKSEKMVLW